MDRRGRGYDEGNGGNKDDLQDSDCEIKEKQTSKRVNNGGRRLG